MKIKSHHIKLIVPATYFMLALIYFVYLFVNTKIDIRQEIGMVVTIAAFVLWLTARWQLGDAFTIGPQAKKLVTTGVYARLRHPVYYFSILAVFGLCVVIWSIPLWICFIAVIILEIYRIKKEETLLEEKFGQEYVNYRKATWF